MNDLLDNLHFLSSEIWNLLVLWSRVFFKQNLSLHKSWTMFRLEETWVVSGRQAIFYHTKWWGKSPPALLNSPPVVAFFPASYMCPFG